MPATKRPEYPNTWEGVVTAAEVAGAKYPELVAAQWALESGWGKSVSGVNNYFGIKGKGTKTTTQEYENGKPVTITAEFQDFPDLGACIQYLVDRWHKDWKQYQGVNRASNAQEAARALVTQGYATDPAYAEKLIKLMAQKAEGKGASSSGAKASGKGSVLFRLEAGCDTYLKKEPKQASELGEKELVEVPGGKAYGVMAYEEVAADAHARVELEGGAGTWYVFEPHWRRMQGAGKGVKSLSGEVNWNDFNYKVTPNLTVGEILQWDKRRVPSADSAVRAWLVATAKEYQAVRDAWGASLGVTSFYRPDPINSEVGGVKGSQHTKGLAMDVYPVKGDLEAFYQWIRVRWTGGLGDGRSRGFIHLDRRDGGHFVPGAGVRPAVEWLY